MLFRQLFDGDTGTYTYLLADEDTREAVIVDSVREQVARDAELVTELGLTLLWALETHVHADHVTAAGVLRERTGATTVWGKLGARCADRHVGDGDVVQIGSIAIHVLETPGHTDDSVSYHVADRVLTGDALFVRGTGRTDFQNGDPRQLFQSITEKLFTLPDATFVYPGHDYRGFGVSTIGEEKRHNPRLAGRSADEFVAIMNALRLPAPKKLDVAVPANRACGLA